MAAWDGVKGKTPKGFLYVVGDRKVPSRVEGLEETGKKERGRRKRGGGQGAGDGDE